MVASAPSFCDLSLNCVIRDACPKPVKQPSTQANSACAGTWLCTKTVDRAGSMPSARYCAAVTRVRLRSSAGSCAIGDRVQVDDAEVGVVVVLQADPLLDRAQRVAEVQGVGRGLHAGEDDARSSQLMMALILPPSSSRRDLGSGVLDGHRGVIGPAQRVGVGALDAGGDDARRPASGWPADSRCASPRRCRTPCRATTTSCTGPATSGCITRTTSTHPVASRSVTHCRSAGRKPGLLLVGLPRLDVVLGVADVPVAAHHGVAPGVAQDLHPRGDGGHEAFLLQLPVGLRLAGRDVDAGDGQVGGVDLEVAAVRGELVGARDRSASG